MNKPVIDLENGLERDARNDVRHEMKKSPDTEFAINRVTGDKSSAISYSADFTTPVALFDRLSRSSRDAFLFESTEGDGRLARYSFLGVDPLLVVEFDETHAHVECHADNLDNARVSFSIDSPIDFLRNLLKNNPVPSHPLIAEAPFAGGLVGYLGYGATSFTEHISQQSSSVSRVPIGRYGLYDSFVLFDHQYRRVTFFSARGEQHINELVHRSLLHSQLPPFRLDMPKLSKDELFKNVTGPFTRESFINAVLAAKGKVLEGEVFQIVVSQRFSLPISAPPIDVYRALQATNPSPYAYFLKCPGFSYLGSSPETFVRSTEGQVLLLRAIAGTRPRGKDRLEDVALELELKQSEKEIAEHRMLVDLGRNDLGRICAPGTVKIGELACMTRYTHVMHLATEVTGSLAPGKDVFHAFESCFPAGTVSGAPKVRAMEILAELEPEQRGIYSGAVGYFDTRGNMDGAIAIRSVLIKDGMAHINAGAGIVYDSDPDMEYEETRSKALSVIQAVRIAHQLTGSR
ncbi:MAG: anthranilate synthase component I family protein [Candidatus Melainabacteria bacterium]|nr:anthranilate synthase component I family protein [Candidatus Melainabacteria bacterium]